MRVISLGWGVQSFTLAAMAALGEIEPVDYVIHSDTGYESVLTYEFAESWSWWLEVQGVNVVTVNEPNARVVINRGGGNLHSCLHRIEKCKRGDASPSMYATLESSTDPQVYPITTQRATSRDAARNKHRRMATDAG